MEKKTFEGNIKELEAIIKELESGDIDLENSMKKYEKAIELVEMCNKELKNASETINKIMNANGKLEEFNTEN